MVDVTELVEKAFHFYELAPEHLDRENYMDSCEKAWATVETLRKTLLVKVGISYYRAKR